MNLPTEPIGSIPRPPALIDAMRAFAAGRLEQAELARLGDEAVRETIAAFEATGSPVVTDGEQTKPSFATYPMHGTTDDCGFAPFADDTSTARETAFAKIRARVEGTGLASRVLGV